MNGDPTPDREPAAGRPPGAPGEGRPLRWGRILMFAALGLLLWTWLADLGAGRQIAYSEFREHLAAGEVERCRVGEDRIEGTIRAASPPAGAGPDGGPGPPPAEPAAPGEPAEPAAPAEPDQAAEPEPWAFYTLRVEDPGLVEALEASGIEYTGVASSNLGWLWIWLLLAFLLMPLLLLPLLRRGMGQAASRSPFGFGRSRARLAVAERTGVTFADVAGCEEAKTDLREVVAFLKNPERFARLGARVPKGVLLLGPPGTGKTLLARAVAGEAGVPFFSISGSEFVEMFVGVGAARVRDLFEQAKRRAPCIVFVDEIDGIGRSRGVHVGMVNDEREQTLNQLLVELDGFEPNSGVMMLAATNRPDVLDPALLRPGRFDRQVVLDAPDAAGREAILRVHARGKPLAPDVDLTAIARGTPGFSGADLANALNEAALLASRRDSDRIAQRDLEEAVERLVAGPERQSRRMRASERRRVAYHEAGHALVAHYSPHADPVQKISIVPRGRAALGYTMQRPVEEQLLLTRSELVDRITGLLGGRCAEELVFDEVSTGAADDLERATDIARQMVAMFGMGEAGGLMRCVRDGAGYLRGADGLQRDCSEDTARRIDEEVKDLLERSRQRARRILEEHRGELEQVAQRLLERERLEKADFERMLGPRPAPAREGPAAGGGLDARAGPAHRRGQDEVP